MTLMEAYYRCSRSSQENRVTEVFATVLDHIPAYVGLLAARVGLEELDRRGLSVEDEPGRKGGWIGFALTLPLKRFATAEGLEDQEHIVLNFCQHALNTLLTSPR